ncbi:Eco57I restriction-modification methylase domain-containing protein [Peptococcaceae bacterium]|nr:Eco57I restriction-modification methylase domain-containing protein [Peptococcaceae bacterium]
MNKEQAKKLIKDTFESSFNKEKFVVFIKNLLNRIEESPFIYRGNFIPDAFEQYISTLERVGKYTEDENEIDLLIVKLKRETSLERARTMQRNFIAWYLKGSRGGKLKDAALVAFVSPDKEDWRFSLVKMDYRFEEGQSGRVKVKEEFTPARRWSFLVGKNEKSHTAQSKLVSILEDDEHNPTLAQLEEAFNIEPVTKEFFDKYRILLVHTVDALDNVVKRDQTVRKDFELKNINTVDFAKKLLGQIVFLYFLQKKGWFGVERDAEWGTGAKDFLRRLFNKEYGDYKNFFNDILEPLFYEALARERDDDFYSRFNCKIPFLNGGLFEPIGGYDWVHTDILLTNELFSNRRRTPEGDIGDGILDVFDRFNFTVKEDEPLEKEVAIDPELLGKLYEKFNAIRPDNFYEYKKALVSGKRNLEKQFNKKFGVYYTPREIVHYMCQQSLINYLSCELEGKVNKEDIEKLIKYGEQFTENEAAVLEKGRETQTYKYHLPLSIRTNAKFIDDKLKDIKICDPAIGSGAFPVGMMHEIIKTRNVLTTYIEEGSTGIPACEEGNTDISVCGDIHKKRRNLPHWTKSGAIYWVTFRLADSLPVEKLSIWKTERDIWLKKHPEPWSDKEWQEYNKRFSTQLEKWLDAGYGSCILALPDVREKLQECIMKFNEQRLRIHSAVIMPNHVHLLLEPLEGYSLSELLKGIKGASAREINKILGTTGRKIWMEESYDHIVRSEEQYFHFIRYIANNPIKADLPQDKYWLYLPDKVTQAFLPVEEQSQTRMSVLRSIYNFKRECIENSLYGVDIDAGACEVARLRLWLSLIVDEEDIRKIKPLPNLDYKIVCSNSLLGVEKDLFNNELFNELEKLKPLYFRETNPTKKQEYKNQIEELISKITKGHKEFDFEVYFSEVFHHKGGFDVVIANPPYVRQEKIKDQKSLLSRAGYEVYNSTSDLYTYFYERSWNILKPDGFSCFISSNKWMRAKYGENLRRFFKKKTEVMNLIDFGGYPVFEATVDTNILLFKKKQPNKTHKVRFVNVTQAFLPVENDVISFLEENQSAILQEKLDDKCWTLADERVLKLKEKIERIGKPLRDWNVRIYRGLLTGFNDAFIIDTETRKRILTECKTEEERKRTEDIMKPILRGRDIGRYYYKWAGVWVIKIEAGWTNKNRKGQSAEKCFQGKFPSLYKKMFSR